MRWILASACLAVSMSAALTARADCAGPFECFCPSVMDSPVVVGVVTTSDRKDNVASFELRVEDVHLREGQLAADWAKTGDVVSGEAYGEIESGDRLVVALDPTTSQAIFSAVVEQDDGSVACWGFSSKDLTVSDIVEVRLADDCFTALTDKMATFDVPECNDVLVGPFGCAAVPPSEGAGWIALFGLAGWLAKRRRGALTRS